MPSQLDGLAGGASGGNDDDPSSRVNRSAICLGIEGELVIAGWLHS